jgi:hypothetical protein
VVTASENFQYCGSTNGGACNPCGLRQSCTNGACTNSDAGIGTIGAACSTSNDCTAVPTVAGGGPPICKGQALILDDSFNYQTGYAYPGGMCTRRCTSDTQCGAGSICAFYGGYWGEVDSICLPNCNSSACRPGYVCTNFGGTIGNFCLVAAADGGVPSYDAGAPAVGNVMGQACSLDSVCRPPSSGACAKATLPDAGPSGFPNGYCYGNCSMYPDDTYCGNNGICYPQIDQYLTGPAWVWTCGGKCDPLATTTGCRTGYWCDQIYGSAAPNDGLCEARCTNAGITCPGGTTCNATTGACQ